MQLSLAADQLFVAHERRHMGAMQGYPLQQPLHYAPAGTHVLQTLGWNHSYFICWWPAGRQQPLGLCIAQSLQCPLVQRRPSTLLQQKLRI